MTRRGSKKSCLSKKKSACKSAKKRCTYKKGKGCKNMWSEAVRVAGNKGGFTLKDIRKGNKYYKLVKKEYNKGKK